MKITREERINLQKKLNNKEKLNNNEIEKINDLLDQTKLGLKLFYSEEEETINGKNIKDYYYFFKEEEDLEVKNTNEKSNLLIEGDNYFALKHLIKINQKIDIIYIDPPYNTKNKDFIYNDVRISKDDEFKHSKWLSFMEKRLKLAQKILSDSGVIFISIDDNEQAYLKVLMDEIFGEENFISNIGWLKNNAQNDAYNFQKNYEYILIYSKNYNIFSINKNINKIDINNKTISLIIGAGFKSKSLKHHPETGQTIYWNKNLGDFKIIKDYDFSRVITGKEKIYEIYRDDKDLLKNNYIPIRPPRFFYNGEYYLGRWTWGIDTMKKNINNLVVKEKKDGNLIIERIDNRLYSNLPFKNFIENISSSGGTILLKKILNETFPNPKPIDLIKYLIKLIPNNKNYIILDFFAGSGTTGHAVMDLNKEDNGNRKFILVTNNENNISKEICYERLYRLISGKGTKEERDFDWLKNNKPYLNENLKYIKIKLEDKIEGNYEEIESNQTLYKSQFEIDDLSIEEIA